MSKYRITHIRTYVKNLDLIRPYTIAYETFDSVVNIFLEIETDEGLVAIGSGSPSAFVTGETMESAQKALLDLNNWLLGKDIRELNSLIREIHRKYPKNPAVVAAADIALHDAYGKMLDIPLVKMWGIVHKRLPTSVTIGIKSEQESVREAQEYMDRGFKIIKLKTGKSVAEDIAIFSKIRETVGKAIKIRVDANQGYSVKDTKKFYKATKKIGLELIEQPLPFDDLKTMKRLPKKIRKICMADESLKTTTNAVRLARTPHKFGLYNIKLMKCGGMAAGKQIANIAHWADIGLMWGCMDESIISITAGLHAALSSPATRYLDLDGSLDLATDVVTGGFVLQDGYLSLTDAPGLGVTKIP